MIPENLEELKSLKQWVNYIRIWNPTKNGGAGGYDKPPINPNTLRDGKTNNPDSWADYAQAAANIGKTATHKDTKHKTAQGKTPLIRAAVEGAGLILCGGYAGVDLDHVIDASGNLAPFAAEIVERLDTYTEVSPSGTGLHCLLFCGDLLESGQDFGGQFTLDESGEATTEERKIYELEIYVPKTGGRYFTVTGKAYRDRPIRHDKSAELRQIFSEYAAKREAFRAVNSPAASSPVGSQHAAVGPSSYESERKMIDSALPFIAPDGLDFREWASIMTALKVSGYTLGEAEAWSSGLLSGTSNVKNDPATNARRWNKFHFNGGDGNAAGTIINKAKARGWDPAQAFSDAERIKYGQSIHTDEERREYGRKKHEERVRDAFEDMEAGFLEYFKNREAGSQEAERGSSSSVGSQLAAETAQEDRREDWEATPISAAEWDRKGYTSVTLDIIDGIPAGDVKHQKEECHNYKEYIDARARAHASGLYILQESPRASGPNKAIQVTGKVSAAGFKEFLDQKGESFYSVGSLSAYNERLDRMEPKALTLEEWDAGGYYAALITADPGDIAKALRLEAVGYYNYIALREYFHCNRFYVVYEAFETEADFLTGLVTGDSLISEFENTDVDIKVHNNS